MTEAILAPKNTSLNLTRALRFFSKIIIMVRPKKKIATIRKKIEEGKKGVVREFNVATKAMPRKVED